MPYQITKYFSNNKPAPAVITGAGLFAFFVALYWNSIGNLIHLWSTDDTYSHGFLIPFLSIYLISLRNKALTHLTLKPAPLLLIPLTLTLCLWLLASITDTRTIELTLLPFIFIFTYLSIIGYQASLLLIAPLLYICVALPIWGVLTPLFQTMAVTINEIALQLTGISTYIKGTTVSIPAGTFEVEGGCAGIRYLVVTLALGGFFSLSNLKNKKSIITLMIASLLIPIVFNWLRIYIIILIGHFSDMQSPLVSDHKNFGWALYGISLIPLFIISRKLSDPENIQKVIISDTIDPPKIPNTIFFSILVLILIGSAPAFTYLLNRTEVNTLNDIIAPDAALPWLGPIHSNEWKPNYKGASIEVSSLYIGADELPNILLNILYYGNQSQDKELINELNNIVEPEFVDNRKIINLNNQNVVEERIIKDNSKRLVWYWYYINNKDTVIPVIAKLLQSNERISGKIYSSLITLSTVCKTDCKYETNILKTFLSKHHNKINSAISK